MTTKLTTTLLGIAAGLTLVTLPQTAQAQNTIAITGGTLTDTNTGSPPLFAISFTTSSQGTFSVTTNNAALPCASFCDNERYLKVSGSGFSPAGPVLFSNVPMVLQTGPSSSDIYPILSGAFNSTTRVYAYDPTVSTLPQAQTQAQTQPTVDSYFQTIFGITGPVASPNFSVGQFRFDPFPAPAAPTLETLTASTQNFTIPDPISLQAGKGQAEAIFQAAQQQSLRPNGMHTRIIPTWTPGLYQ